VNQVFERVGVPYGPRLEPGSEASEEAAKKRKQDAGAGYLAKCTKVSGWKAYAKIVVAKAAQSKSTLGAKVMRGADIPPKTMASSTTSVSKVAATMTSLRTGVLRVNAGTKRPGAIPSPAIKGIKRGSMPGLP
jgi:hypothetical protein